MANNTLHPWDRQATETSKSFAAFSLYLEAGANRSIAGVAEKCRKSASLLWRWSARHAWLERAREFDTFQAAEKSRQLLAKEVDSRLRRARHGELVESTGVRAIQAIAAEVVAGTRQLSVSEAAQLAAVGSRMDKEAVQSAPGVQVNVGVNIQPGDQLDPYVDDATAIKIATCFVDRWLKKYPGRSLPPMSPSPGETLTAGQQALEVERAIRIAGGGQCH